MFKNFVTKYRENKLTKEEVYDAIKSWQYEIGESFLDYFDYGLDAEHFMKWCLDKEYISDSKYNLFKEEDMCSVEDCINGYEVEFAIFTITEDTSDEEVEEYEKKALLMLSEYLTIYNVKDFIKFLAGKFWSTDWNDKGFDKLEETNEEELMDAITEYLYNEYN